MSRIDALPEFSIFYSTFEGQPGFGDFSKIPHIANPGNLSSCKGRGEFIPLRILNDII
jgi:hypothetical protein